MTRDYDIFPDDANGDVLWRMQVSGDDLSKAREIDFNVIFPSETAALNFAAFVLRRGHKISMSQYRGNDRLPWQITVHVILSPSHKEISGFEDFLSREASLFGGKNDGWGCFEMS